MDNLQARLEEISKNYARYSPSKLAEIIGMKQSTVINYFNGTRKPSLELVLKILENIPEIDANWLMRGKGQMINGNSNELYRAESTHIVSDEPPSNYNPMPEGVVKDQLIDALSDQIKLLKEKLKTDNTS